MHPDPPGLEGREETRKTRMNAKEVLEYAKKNDVKTAKTLAGQLAKVRKVSRPCARGKQSPASLGGASQLPRSGLAVYLSPATPLPLRAHGCPLIRQAKGRMIGFKSTLGAVQTQQTVRTSPRLRNLWPATPDAQRPRCVLPVAVSRVAL